MKHFLLTLSIVVISMTAFSQDAYIYHSDTDSTLVNIKSSSDDMFWYAAVHIIGKTDGWFPRNERRIMGETYSTKTRDIKKIVFVEDEIVNIGTLSNLTKHTEVHLDTNGQVTKFDQKYLSEDPVYGYITAEKRKKSSGDYMKESGQLKIAGYIVSGLGIAIIGLTAPVSVPVALSVGGLILNIVGDNKLIKAGSVYNDEREVERNTQRQQPTSPY